MNVLNSLPDVKNILVVLSGGLDSTTSLRLCVEKYGPENVFALSFDYGQRQRHELTLAAKTCLKLGVSHEILDLRVLNSIGMGFSANIDTGIAMPTIKEVLGNPRPVTYVPNRNMILMSLAAAQAEKLGVATIACGFQMVDEYGYWDTTQRFVDKLNDVLNENRNIKIRIIAPFAHLTKKDEIKAILDIDGNLDLFKNTITCYNPQYNLEEDSYSISCGLCPSCSERIKAFKSLNLKDPIQYTYEVF